MKCLMALLLCFPLMTFAQKENLNTREPVINEGQLFTLHFNPGAKRLTISLAGKPQVELGPEQVQILGRLISNSGETSQVKISSERGKFHLDNSIESAKALEFDVTDRTNAKKKETIRLNLK